MKSTSNIAAIALLGATLLAGCGTNTKVVEGRYGTQAVQVYHVKSVFSFRLGTRIAFYNETGGLTKVLYDAGSGSLGDEEGDYVEYNTVFGPTRYGYSEYVPPDGGSVAYADRKHAAGGVARVVREMAQEKFRNENHYFQDIVKRVPSYIQRDLDQDDPQKDLLTAAQRAALDQKAGVHEVH